MMTIHLTVAARAALGAALLVTACSISSAAVAPATPAYAVSARWPVAGEGKWDYVAVDSAHARLYLSRATRVQVLDLTTGALIGEVADTPGVHGIALAQDLGRGYTSNGKSDTVGVFELATLKTIGQVKLSGGNPDAILYDPAKQRVYAFNGRTNNMSVIDARAMTELSTIALPGKPEFAVVEGNRVYVNIEDTATIAVVDVDAGKPIASWALGACSEPTGLAGDVAHHRLYSVCHNKTMVVVDSADGHVVTTLPIGAHVDAAAYDAAQGLVFSSNGDTADVSVIAQRDANRYQVVGHVATAKGAKTMALDPATHRLYVPALKPDGALEVMVLSPAP